MNQDVLEHLVKAVEALAKAVSELTQQVNTANGHNLANRAKTEALRAKRALG
ncbi:MAG: hypothetical protein M5U32_18255 [Myxococcota bacterium]|nr:hypothetical protein [Myxococcota bacterium]